MLKKLGSRKFLMALLPIVLSVIGELSEMDIDPITKVIVGVTAIVYLLVEGAIDGKRASSTADAVQRGLELGRGASAKGASE